MLSWKAGCWVSLIPAAHLLIVLKVGGATTMASDGGTSAASGCLYSEGTGWPLAASKAAESTTPTPSRTEASEMCFDKAKEQVNDLLLMVEVGRLELWPPPGRLPSGGYVGALTCGSLVPVVTVAVSCLPFLRVPSVYRWLAVPC